MQNVFILILIYIYACIDNKSDLFTPFIVEISAQSSHTKNKNPMDYLCSLFGCRNEKYNWNSMHIFVCIGYERMFYHFTTASRLGVALRMITKHIAIMAGFFNIQGCIKTPYGSL